jgi:hypothetical protein
MSRLRQNAQGSGKLSGHFLPRAYRGWIDQAGTVVRSVNRSMSFTDSSRRARYPAQGAYDNQAAYQDSFDANPGYGGQGYGSGQGYGGTQWFQPQGGYQPQVTYQDQPGYPGQPAYQGAYPGAQQTAYQGQAATATMGWDTQQPVISNPAFATDDEDAYQAHRWMPSMMAGAMAGVLAVGLMIGVSMLAAAFVRQDASPVTAVRQAFIDQPPHWLSKLAMHFGTHEKTMIAAGVIVVIAIVAAAIGLFARKMLAAGVTGMVALSLFGAFMAITRDMTMSTATTDAIPSVIGGIAGITVLMWLIRAAYRGVSA